MRVSKIQAFLNQVFQFPSGKGKIINKGRNKEKRKRKRLNSRRKMEIQKTVKMKNRKSKKVIRRIRDKK